MKGISVLDAEQKVLKQQERETAKRRAIEEKEARKQAAAEARAALNAQKEAKKAAKTASIQSVVDSTVVPSQPLADQPSTSATPDYAAELLRQSGMTAPSTSNYLILLRFVSGRLEE